MSRPRYETERLTMTPQEVASLLGCSPKHVRDMCADGRIRAAQIGKLWHINRAALLEQLGLDEEEVVHE